MRPLSAREKALLGLLLVVALFSGYLSFFYQPVTTELAEIDEQITEAEDQLVDSRVKAARLEKMRAELERIQSSSDIPMKMAPYDNLQSVMFELNGILIQTSEYSLDFGTVDTTEPIIRRHIALHFRTESYEQARAVLRQLHDSKYRCLLSTVSVSEDNISGGVEASVNMIFFEYQGMESGV